MIYHDPHKWLDHFFDMRGALVKEISGRVGVCVAWAVVVTVIHMFVRPLSMSPLVHSLIGVALGLLWSSGPTHLTTGTGRDDGCGAAS